QRGNRHAGSNQPVAPCNAVAFHSLTSRNLSWTIRIGLSELDYRRYIAWAAASSANEKYVHRDSE
ncbi:MAG TPA: hypothetical protein VJW93_14485, partial [Candidatus Acidoferrales bacterium]|nr:hypothetical protein [Candidatus Acidoferrales bacterium]